MSKPYAVEDALFDAEQQGNPICPRHGISHCDCCEECGADLNSGRHQYWCSEYEVSDV